MQGQRLMSKDFEFLIGLFVRVSARVLRGFAIGLRYKPSKNFMDLP